MNDAAWWARVVQARTEWDDLRPQRVWTLHKGERAAAIDLKAVPDIGAEPCSRWTGSGARRGCCARTSRRNCPTRLRRRGRYSRGRVGREYALRLDELATFDDLAFMHVGWC